MKLIDTHAHLYAQEFSADIDQVMARSLDHHIQKTYMPNIDADTIEAMLALEARYPDQCAAMIGIHPCHIDQAYQKQLAQVEAWLSKRKFAAMGEIGIDLYREKAYQAQQEEALTIQLAWAKQYQLPVVIHCRASFQETLKVLQKHWEPSLKGIFHCFSGSLQEAEQITELGFYLGIGGILTFKQARLAQVLTDIKLEHLVLETDAPYLAPVPHRGQRNEPAHLLYIAEQLATIKEVSLATVAAVTTDNANKVFNLKS